MESDKFQDYLNALLSRATGGSDVAAAPNASPQISPLPVGLAAPASTEIMAWVTSQDSKKSVARIAIMVGGAGNGKSELTAKAVSGLHEIQADESSIAKRSYRYAIADKELLLVNDATIGLGNAGNAGMAKEINSAIARGDNLVVNVNRGVIFEELYNNPDLGGSLILNWLADPDIEKSDSDKNGYWLRSVASADYAASVEVYEEERLVAAVAVCFMDVCSLLEPQPIVTLRNGNQESLDFEASPYKITQFRKRMNLEVAEVPAANLLERLVEELLDLLPEGESTNSEFEVVISNIKTLGVKEFQRNILSLLRAGEIASSRLITYRELWGAIARLILGDSAKNLHQIVEGKIDESSVFGRVSDPILELREKMEKAKNRCFLSLFADSGDYVDRSSPSDAPVLRLTQIVDPVRDVSPEWSSPVVNAFAMSTPESSPLSDLVSGAQDLEILERCITPFDRELDRLYSSVIWLPEIKDNVRNSLTSWYGSYLTRILALSLGEVGFKSEISSWTQTWARDKFSDELSKGLKTLLLPTSGSDDESLSLPAYATRTAPLTTGISEPTLVVKVPKGWRLVPRKKAETLFVDLVEEARIVVTLELDFPLLREALACVNGNAGVTEYVNATSPRLERFRAALLIPNADKTQEYWILSKSGGQRVYVDTIA
jgi:hypothetical protein